MSTIHQQPIYTAEIVQPHQAKISVYLDENKAASFSIQFNNDNRSKEAYRKAAELFNIQPDGCKKKEESLFSSLFSLPFFSPSFFTQFKKSTDDYKANKSSLSLNFQENIDDALKILEQKNIIPFEIIGSFSHYLKQHLEENHNQRQAVNELYMSYFKDGLYQGSSASASKPAVQTETLKVA